MFDSGSRGPLQFDVRSRADRTETLVVGFSEFGLAGLTAVDYLVTHLDLEQVGHIRVEGLPAITPFAEGRPRHHTRLYSREDLEVTVLVGELFLPAAAADGFGGAIIDWTEREGAEEAVVLSGVPIAHGPEGHRTYFIATEDYRKARLGEAVEGEEGDGHPAAPVPMGGGYLDGVNGSIVGHAMHSDLRGCVFTTPVHAQAPDADAALRLLRTLDAVYDLGVDLGPLQEFAARVAKQYEELASRMQAAREETGAVPEDRMYM